ncbi:PREDICTED: cocaine esterase-like [Branchiostoma belcheri]|uniref:Carboxylic ester hydrolase n=1 Tax=Branchiostoma belcheri TaxID=7741 RepID=A0A6P4XPU3_BRABE|nr:PREDICTED: cocaine esterase-like [Branchiostoma belcheri]
MAACYCRRGLRALWAFLAVTVGLKGGSGVLDAAVVSTTYGDVRGSEFMTSGVVGNAVVDRVFTFKGIPYAAPPVGDLRWRPPEDPVSWTSERDATEFGPVCPQNPGEGPEPYPIFQEFVARSNSTSEDCLFLNVYTPSVSDNANLPVMVWLHGGGMVRGSGDEYPAEIPTSLHNVVMVTINFRLGNLGFLPTLDNDAPGNFGPLDAMKALEWIQANIRNFGGDPDRVTIFGHSGGSWGVSLLVMSPLARGLFHRAISQSGVAGVPVTEKGDLTRTETLARGLNCTTADYDAMMSCLRGKPGEAVKQGAAITAVIGGTFLPESPWDLMFRKDINNIDYLLGTVNNETAFVDDDGLTRQEFQLQLPFSLRRITAQYVGGTVDVLVQPVTDQYVDPGKWDDNIYLGFQFLQQGTDSVFAAPTVLMAQAAAEHGRVYQYEFQQDSNAFSWRPSYIMADHGDDVFYTFGIPLLRDDTGTSWKYNFTQEERDLSLDMMAYWVNFATNGDPNDSTGSARMRNMVSWPRYVTSSQSYLQLDVTSSADVKLREDLMTFWNEEVPRLLGKNVTRVGSGGNGGPSCSSHFILALSLVCGLITSI